MAEPDDERHDDDLDAWLDGSLAPERLPAFVAWLRRDRANRLALVRRARFNSDLRDLVRVRAECGSLNLPCRAVREAPQQGRQPSWWGVIAASAIAAVGAWLIARHPERQDPDPDPTPVSAQEPQPIAPLPVQEAFRARITLTPDAIAQRSDDGTVLRLERGGVDLEADNALLTVETPHARIVADGAAGRADITHDAALLDVRSGSVRVQPGPPEASGGWSSSPVTIEAGTVVRIADGSVVRIAEGIPQQVLPIRWIGIPGSTVGWRGTANADSITAVVDTQSRYNTEIRWVTTPPKGPPLVRLVDDQTIELEVVAEQATGLAVTLVIHESGGGRRWCGNLRKTIKLEALVPAVVRLPFDAFGLVDGRRPDSTEGAVVNLISLVTGGGV